MLLQPCWRCIFPLKQTKNIHFILFQQIYLLFFSILKKLGAHGIHFSFTPSYHAYFHFQCAGNDVPGEISIYLFVLLIFLVTPPFWGVYFGAPWFSVSRELKLCLPEPGFASARGEANHRGSVSKMKRCEHTNPNFLPLQSYQEPLTALNPVLISNDVFN